MIEEIHKDDIGTKFLVMVMDGSSVVDLSGATVKKIAFKKSDGTSVEKSALFKTDGSDGKIYYVTIADDLSMSGKWELQAKVTLPTGVWSSSIKFFMVYDNL